MAQADGAGPRLAHGQPQRACDRGGFGGADLSPAALPANLARHADGGDTGLRPCRSTAAAGGDHRPTVRRTATWVAQAKPATGVARAAAGAAAFRPVLHASGWR